MIKTISQMGAFTQVTSYTPPHVYNTNQGAGQVRYNTTTQQMEVSDGNSWFTVSSTASVGLTQDAEEAIRWAKNKQQEEQSLKERLEKHPGLKQAWEEFQTLDILTREFEDR